MCFRLRRCVGGVLVVGGHVANEDGETALAASPMVAMARSVHMQVDALVQYLRKLPRCPCHPQAQLVIRARPLFSSADKTHAYHSCMFAGFDS